MSEQVGILGVVDLRDEFEKVIEEVAMHNPWGGNPHPNSVWCHADTETKHLVLQRQREARDDSIALEKWAREITTPLDKSLDVS